MSRSSAIVLTYPGHFLLTQLTIRSLQKWFPEVETITVVVDDCGPQVWDGYLDACREIFVDVRPISNTNIANISSGWVRQQMVKLHIDWFTETDEIFISDGDIVYHKHIPHKIIPASYSVFNEIDDLQTIYVQNMLHLPRRFFTLNTLVNVNNAGFRDVEVSWIKQMRNYIESIHNTSLLELHRKMTSYSGVSEWELLETFKVSNLKLEPNLLSVGCNNLENILCYGEYYYSTTWEADRHFSKSWWQKQNINTEVWDLLPDRKLLN